MFVEVGGVAPRPARADVNLTGFTSSKDVGGIAVSSNCFPNCVFPTACCNITITHSYCLCLMARPIGVRYLSGR